MPARFGPEVLASTLVVGPTSSPEARRRMSRSGALLYAAGAVTLAFVAATPGDLGNPDRFGLAACAVACALIAALLWAWRSPPVWSMHALCPGGSVMTTVALSAADPVTVAPVFYVLPVTMAAYFLPQRDLVANLAIATAGYMLALALWIESTNPVQELATVVGASAIAGVTIFRLRRQVQGLVEVLQGMATQDPLTGALNHAAFVHRLDDEIARARRSGAPCAVAMLDVDHFKAINDRHGHAVGDHALKRLAAVVEDTTRRADVFGRLGGEEFALLLVDTTIDGAETVAEHLRARLADDTETVPEGLTVSIGVADASAPHATPREVLREADRALYAAKRAGRNRVHTAPPAVRPER